MKKRVGEQEKRRVRCPKCGARTFEACQSWHDGSDMERAHEERRAAYLAMESRGE